MKVLLYSEGMYFIAKSGVGRAIKHQMQALSLNNIDYTTNPFSDDYDIIHINTTGLISSFLARRARRQHKGVVIHAHSTEEDFKNSFLFSNKLAPFFKKRLEYIYNQADLLLTPTNYSKQLLESYNIDVPIIAISNGVDLNHFKKDLNAGARFRRNHNFTPNDKLIISAGLQIKRKGILDFIELAKEMPDYKFLWCGYTNPHLMTTDVKVALKSIPENVYFLGYVTDMQGAYNSADLFFMPTYEETEGIVVLEALATKTPVLIRDIPVYKNWLLDKKQVYKGKDNPSFKAIIEAHFNNRDLSLENEAYKVVAERSLDKIGCQLSQIYEEVINEVAYEVFTQQE